MEEKNPIREEYVKLNFFKKVWYSISKFEKYPEMAALGVKKAIIYFTELMLIFSVLLTFVYVYYVSNIAEFDEEDLSLSGKIITKLTEVYDDEQIKESMQILNDYPESLMIFTLIFSLFISFYITTLIDVFTLSIFVLLTCMIAKIKMNYKAVFNMSIFALTLSIILKMIYLSVEILTNFEIKYFEIMYISISYVCLAAAIFMIKSDVIKQQLQLMKIIEEGKEKIEQTITIPKKPKEDEKEEEKENKDKGDEDDAEGQGSNA